MFNAYSDIIFIQAQQNKELRVKANDEIINNIRYADDMIILSDSIPDFENVFDSANTTGWEMCQK